MFVSSRSPAIGALVYRFFFGWEGSPTEIEHRKKQVGTLILSSLPEDLVIESVVCHNHAGGALDESGCLRTYQPNMSREGSLALK